MWSKPMWFRLQVCDEATLGHLSTYLPGRNHETTENALSLEKTKQQQKRKDKQKCNGANLGEKQKKRMLK